MLQAINAWPVKAVLFDLDGTLVDTAPDLAAALNAVLQRHNKPALAYPTIRAIVSNGADALITLAFGSNIKSSEQQRLKAELISHYQQNIATQSKLFDGLAEALDHLENRQIPWGIVTNKPAHLTLPLLEQLGLDQRAACIVCGDQVNQPKPHPESIYLACKQLSISPEYSIYIGDAERDIRSGRLAGLKTIACAYGYIDQHDDINSWQADQLIETPIDLLHALKTLTP